MAELQFFPPTDESKAISAAIPGARFTPGVVATVDGEPVGPEAAGAVMVLHMTAVDEEDTRIFWQRTSSLKATLPGTPGFIRLISLVDGLSGYAIGFWRTAEDARRFAVAAAHSGVMKEFRERPFQASHFVGLWSTDDRRPRRLYCERCHTPATAPADACPQCGNALHDVFVEQMAAAAPRA